MKKVSTGERVNLSDIRRGIDALRFSSDSNEIAGEQMFVEELMDTTPVSSYGDSPTDFFRDSELTEPTGPSIRTNFSGGANGLLYPGAGSSGGSGIGQGLAPLVLDHKGRSRSGSSMGGSSNTTGRSSSQQHQQEEQQQQEEEQSWDGLKPQGGEDRDRQPMRGALLDGGGESGAGEEGEDGIRRPSGTSTVNQEEQEEQEEEEEDDDDDDFEDGDAPLLLSPGGTHIIRSTPTSASALAKSFGGGGREEGMGASLFVREPVEAISEQVQAKESLLTGALQTVKREEEEKAQEATATATATATAAGAVALANVMAAEAARMAMFSPREVERGGVGAGNSGLLDRLAASPAALAHVMVSSPTAVSMAAAAAAAVATGRVGLAVGDTASSNGGVSPYGGVADVSPCGIAANSQSTFQSTPPRQQQPQQQQQQQQHGGWEASMDGSNESSRSSVTATRPLSLSTSTTATAGRGGGDGVGVGTAEGGAGTGGGASADPVVAAGAAAVGAASEKGGGEGGGEGGEGGGAVDDAGAVGGGLDAHSAALLVSSEAKAEKEKLIAQKLQQQVLHVQQQGIGGDGVAPAISRVSSIGTDTSAGGGVGVPAVGATALAVAAAAAAAAAVGAGAGGGGSGAAGGVSRTGSPIPPLQVEPVKGSAMHFIVALMRESRGREVLGDRPEAYALRVAEEEGVPDEDMPELDPAAQVVEVGVEDFVLCPTKALNALFAIKITPAFMSEESNSSQSKTSSGGGGGGANTAAAAGAGAEAAASVSGGESGGGEGVPCLRVRYWALREAGGGRAKDPVLQFFLPLPY